MHDSNAAWFRRGLKAGVPIGLGYLAVAFTLGLAARRSGLSAAQATLASFLTNASAGEYVGFTLIAAQANLLEIAVMELVANARYLLMSFSLSQKLAPETGLLHRLILGWYVTDEVYGVSVSVPGKLNPFYSYGAIALACPGWALGTYLGAVMGEVLPAAIAQALSVGLYGMFLAIIVPPARTARVIRRIVALSMALSYAAARIKWFAGVSPGIRTIVLTVAISAAAAYLAPIREEVRDA